MNTNNLPPQIRRTMRFVDSTFTKSRSTGLTGFYRRLSHPFGPTLDATRLLQNFPSPYLRGWELLFRAMRFVHVLWSKPARRLREFTLKGRRLEILPLSTSPFRTTQRVFREGHGHWGIGAFVFKGRIICWNRRKSDGEFGCTYDEYIDDEQQPNPTSTTTRCGYIL